MTPSDRIRAVSSLHWEIREMEMTIGYLQGRIDRKRIAMTEILTGMECPVELPPARSILMPAEDVRLSMLSMCRAVVEQFQNTPFSYCDVKNKLQEQFPDRLKLYKRQTFYGAFRVMREEGIIEPSAEGFIRTQGGK